MLTIVMVVALLGPAAQVYSMALPDDQAWFLRHSSQVRKL